MRRSERREERGDTTNEHLSRTLIRRDGRQYPIRAAFVSGFARFTQRAEESFRSSAVPDPHALIEGSGSGTCRKEERTLALGLYVRACTWFLRWHVPRVFDSCGVGKVLAEVGDGLEKKLLVRQGDVLEEHQVLVDLPHVADVGDDADRVPVRQEHDCEVLTDPGESGAIGLDDADR